MLKSLWNTSSFFLYWAVINISGVSKLTWPKTYLVLLHFYLKYDWMLRTCLASLYPWSSCLVRSAHLDTTFSHLCVTDANRFLIRITSCFWLKYFRCVPAQETKSQVTFSLHFVFFRIVLNNIIFVSRICVVIKEIISQQMNYIFLPKMNDYTKYSGNLVLWNRCRCLVKGSVLEYWKTGTTLTLILG